MDVLIIMIKIKTAKSVNLDTMKMEIYAYVNHPIIIIIIFLN